MYRRAVDVVEGLGTEQSASDGRRRRLLLAGCLAARARLRAALEAARLVSSTDAGPSRRSRARCRLNAARRVGLDDGAWSRSVDGMPVGGDCRRRSLLVHLPADDRAAAVSAVCRNAAVLRRD